MIHVVDASVAVKWFARGRWAEGEDHVDHAIELLLASRRGAVSFLQPTHFHAELLAVLARLAPEQMSTNLRDLMDLDIARAESRTIYARAVDLSIRLGHRLFDTLYHAVALETAGARLVTADRRYFDKACELGAIVWLPDLELRA